MANENPDRWNEALEEHRRRLGYNFRRLTSEDPTVTAIAEGQWYEVRPLDESRKSTLVRFDRNGGRFMLTGLMLGVDRSEVTARQLREIKVGELADAFVGYKPEPDAVEGETIKEAHERLGQRGTNREFLVSVFQASQWANAFEEVDEIDAPPPRRGVPPPDALLRKFAQRYSNNLQLQPRKAMTATAEELFIDRSTANRYARLCREPSRGYLPPKEES